jgi:glutaredoxin
MRCRTLAALLVSMVLFAPALPAESTEPEVYLFWSARCPYSKAARTFLAAAQIKDHRLRVRDFEVDESISNARLLGRLYEKIGLAEFMMVPLVVVGNHVVIGFIDEETTGAEILSNVAECRKHGCKDAVHSLIEEEVRLDQVTATTPAARFACKV